MVESLVGTRFKETMVGEKMKIRVLVTHGRSCKVVMNEVARRNHLGVGAHASVLLMWVGLAIIAEAGPRTPMMMMTLK